MAGLIYRQDMDAVRERLSAWWRGESLGRPALQISVPAEAPIDDPDLPPAMPMPDGWVTDYSTSNFDYRVNIGRCAFVGREFLAEGVPVVNPDLGPNCLALYLGCRGVEMPGTVWFEPFINEPEPAVPKFRFDPSNFYWDFNMRLVNALVPHGRGRWLLQFPDFIEGLDTLAAMRGTEPLLFDLIERPDWVHACLKQITSIYFECYDRFYEVMKDETGGSVFWCWAPGRVAKFQCDFSAMISPDMYAEFMLPELREMTERVDHCLYHLDGPGAICHVDHLLSLPRLDMIQWIAGSGAAPSTDKCWWPLLHKIVDAGKKVMIGVYSDDEILTLRREFGKRIDQFLFGCYYQMTKRDAEHLISTLER